MRGDGYTIEGRRERRGIQVASEEGKVTGLGGVKGGGEGG